MKNYARKWIIQRITAILLIPLSFWFIYHCLSFASMNYSQLFLFFKSIINSLLFLIMMISMLIHAKLGCETIVEDYVTSKSLKDISTLLINLIVYLSMIIISLAIVRIVLI
jgi:succinate dehydrogenase / fumarate reductase membrane anchor subunit|tara:strand:- start:347 stop:679 length:333 start_codon:yes stop_codon:yes gene_type:complete